MFSAALADHVTASWLDSSWFDIHSLAANLIEGVISTFIGLAILFSRKPRLTIKLCSPQPGRLIAQADPPQETDKRSEAFAFRVTNKSLSKAIEVKVRLLKISRHSSRNEIKLVVDELFELRGRLSPLEPSIKSLLRARLQWLNYSAAKRKSAKETAKKLASLREADKRDRAHFTFYPGKDTLEKEIISLREQDYILFQVVAKNAFTNFSRLEKRHFYKPELEEKAKIARERASTGSAGQA